MLIILPPDFTPVRRKNQPLFFVSVLAVGEKVEMGRQASFCLAKLAQGAQVFKVGGTALVEYSPKK